MRRNSGKPELRCNPSFFRKNRSCEKLDHPKSGLPDFGHLKWASRINPTCMVKPGGDESCRAGRGVSPLGVRLLVLPVADEVVDHRGVGERRGVAEIAVLVFGDLAQDSAHDL